MGEVVNVTHPRCSITLFDGNTQLQATSSATPGEYAPFLDKNFEPDQREKLFREILAKQKFTIKASKEAAALEIKLWPVVPIRGTVVNAQDGKPLAGAEVHFERPPNRAPSLDNGERVAMVREAFPHGFGISLPDLELFGVRCAKNAGTACHLEDESCHRGARSLE